MTRPPANASKPVLNAKQLVFVREYLVDFNASQAAVRAGYAARSAGSMGHELLNKPEIQAEIAAIQKHRAEASDITNDQIELELARIAFFDPGAMYREDGSMLSIKEMPAAVRAAIARYEVTELASEGVRLGTAYKVKHNDKLKALELLCRMRGMMNDKLTLGGDAKNPLYMLIQSVQGHAITPRMSF